MFREMSRKRLLIRSASIIVGALILVGVPSLATSQQVPTFQPRSLEGATPQEVGAAAVAYTQVRFRVASGTPQVLVTRPVLATELPALGLPSIGFGGVEPPLMLVALHGDFDLAGRIYSMSQTSNWVSRVRYIVYVMDLRAGLPTLTQTSLNGGPFRQVLGDVRLTDDPVLPADPQEPYRSRAVGARAPDLSTTRLPYGSVAPPAPAPDAKAGPTR